MDLEPFEFTEGKVKKLCKDVANGTQEPCSVRDTGSSNGLWLRVGARGGVYYSIRRANGKKHRKRIGPVSILKVTTARERATSIAAGQEGASKPIRAGKGSVTADQAFESYIEAALSGTFGIGRKAIRESTAKSYRELWRPHVAKIYGQHKLMHLANGIMDIHTKLNNRKGAQKKMMQVLKNTFEHATREGWWNQANPVIDQATGKAVMCQGTKSRERFLSDSELLMFVEWIEDQPDPWPDYFRILLNTGIRKSTVNSMRWADIDIGGKNPTWRLTAEANKNDDPLVVPLVDEVVAVLKTRKKRRKKNCPWVFPTERNSKSGHIEEPAKRFQKMLDECEMDQDLRIHDLRRTAGTLAVKDNSLPAVARFLGQKTLAAVTVYARAGDKDARMVANSVSARIREAEE